MIYLEFYENGGNYIHSDAEELAKLRGVSLDDLRESGILVDSVPEPDLSLGREYKLNWDGNQLYYEYGDIIPEPVDKQVEKLKQENNILKQRVDSTENALLTLLMNM